MLQRKILRRNLECKIYDIGKLDVVKQEMARINIDILCITELKLTGMGQFNSNYYHNILCKDGHEK